MRPADDEARDTLARLDRTCSLLDQAQRQAPVSGVGTYGPLMEKIAEAHGEAARLCGEQFRKVVKR